MKKNISILLFFLLLATSIFAQRETNKQMLEQLSIKHESSWKQARERVEKYASENNITIRTEFEDGTILELVDVKDGRPIYYITDNIEAAATTHASNLWNNPDFGGGITGAGFDKVAIWDGGRVRFTHQEFNNTGIPRVTTGDNASNSDHATHVAGTIVAGGVDPNAKGMAFEASLKSYDWNYVESEMATAASQGYLISNHSWGYVTGWNSSGGQWEWTGDPSIDPNEDYRFGYYNTTARDWDEIAYNAPYFLIVKSAGNDRGDGPDNAGTPGVPEHDGGEDGYDCISYHGVSKNILTVGAIKKVPNYTGPASVEMTYFSGWGPADDGRIKPDIVAAGQSLYSTMATNNTAYASLSGTSMSSPNATGSLVLLHQYYQELYGDPMRSSTIKALAIHTAEECGPDEGPDYMHGWGLLNVEKAAILIKNDAARNTIDELTLENNQTYERSFIVSNDEPLRITICWIDPEGPVHGAALNNRTPVLVNDLDLKLIDEDGITYYPYKLDPNNPAAPATKNSTNDVDNVEHIYIENPGLKEYTIIVTHKGTLVNWEQEFSLITSYMPVQSDDDATLLTLTVTPGSLEPSFSPSVTDYTVTVPYEITNISITGTANNSNATVEGNVTNADLIVGDNPFEIIVTAENETTVLTYSVTVIRQEYVISDDATLSSLIVSEGILTPSFYPTNTNYTVDVSNTITSISITGTANHPDATVEGNVVDAELDFEDNYFDIIVTAADGITTKTYTVNVIRENVYHKINSGAYGGGTIEPSGINYYEHGSDITYYMTPDHGFMVDEIFVDGNSIDSDDNTYTFTDISSNHTIIVSFILVTSVEEYDIQDIKIYPNPTKDQVTIESEEVINKITLFNFSGKKIFEKNNIKDKSLKIELNNYPSGVYYLKINNITKKLVIE